MNRISLSPFALPAVIWFGILFAQLFNRVGSVKSFALLVIALATTALTAKARPDPRGFAESWNRPLLVACGVLIAVQLGFLIKQIPDPRLFDGPTMTLEAGRALLAGLNPYELVLDHKALEITGDPALAGYKYGPLMALGYLPLGVALNGRGVLLTNLVLQLLTLWLIYRLTLRIGTRTNALMAVLFYLSLPLVLRQIFAKGATDLLAVVPILAAFLTLEERPGLAGFWVGLSISTKLLPGALAVPCTLPPAGRRAPYLIGLAIGLVPTVVVLAISPVALYDNIILFNAVWPPDESSWLSSAPPFMATAMKAILVVTFLMVGAAVWRRPPPLTTRCGLMGGLTMLLLLSGPAIHNNYQLWWVPVVSVLASLALTRQTTADAVQGAALQASRSSRA